ncbi:MAG: cytochrome c biogenesis CcdA family protein, partial [bacterium]
GTAGVVLRGKIIRIIFGIIIIIFGLHLSELLQLPLLDIENRPFLRRKTISPLQSFLMGLGFAFGWSPCIGPILASILLVASQTRNTINGAILLFSFSLGVGLPFILIGVFSSFFLKYIRKLNRYLPLVQLISGKFLAFIGLALLTGYLEKLSGISQLTSKQLLALLIILFLIYLEIKLLLSTYKKVMGKLEEEFLPRWVSQLFFLDFFLFAGLLFAGKLIGI